jgi:hypothetical protein
MENDASHKREDLATVESRLEEEIKTLPLEMRAIANRFKDELIMERIELQRSLLYRQEILSRHFKNLGVPEDYPATFSMPASSTTHPADSNPPQSQPASSAGQSSASLRSAAETTTKDSIVSTAPANAKFALASTDFFVEKAQYNLTKRATRLELHGKWLAVISIFAPIGVGIYLLIPSLHTDKISTGVELTAVLVRSISAGGFFAAATYILLSFARAHFDEALTLYNRRHALRCGRLYIYLKRGIIKDVDEFEKAFCWNDAFTSAFGNIEPNNIPKTLPTETLKAAVELTKTAAERLKAAAANT